MPTQVQVSLPYVDHEYQQLPLDRYLLRPLRFLLRDAELRSKNLVKLARLLALLKHKSNPQEIALKRTIQFSDRSNSLYLGNPIILAAGANKDACYIPEHAYLGFGGITVGTATRLHREGNSHRPRIALIPADRAMHNSMGLNNPGIDVISRRVDDCLGRAQRMGLAVGISVAETPGLTDDDERLEDVLETFRKAYRVAHYVEINVSCPNTGEHRVDLDTRFLEKVLAGIKTIRKAQPVRKAVYAKLSPDFAERHLLATLDVVRDQELNGLVLFNTFPAERSRYLQMQTSIDSLPALSNTGAKGGISGRILYRNTFRAVEYIKNRYPEFSIIACGGVDHGRKVWDLLRMGADAVQSYSVVGYRWMAAMRMREELLEGLRGEGLADLTHFYEKRATTVLRNIS